jgi:thiol-disulfide isomerase/thioredoxin
MPSLLKNEWAADHLYARAYSFGRSAMPEKSSPEQRQAFDQQVADATAETEEGFNARRSAVVRMDRTPPATNQDGSPWTAINKPLTAFRGPDLTGKVWTIEDLQGKATLINVWATWCRSCQPYRRSSIR